MMLSNIKNRLLCKEELIQEGKNLIKSNSFYYTLHVLLRYYFVQSQDFYMMSFLKDVTNTESEFKVFMVYVEFAIYVYNTYIKDTEEFKNGNKEDIVFILISYVKQLYSNNKDILKPFITSVNENQDEILDKFNKVKSMYNFKKDSLEKFTSINNVIYYLQKAKEHEEESKRYSNMALDILKELKDQFKNNIFNKDLLKEF